MYKDTYHLQVKKDLKRLQPLLREAIKTQHIPEILTNPTQGEMIGKRSEFYTLLKRRTKL